MKRSDTDFEANFTAWLDGRLEAGQVAAFEQELRARGFDPVAERTAFAATASLLQQHSEAPQLGNPDFFQHRLLDRIQQSQREEAPVAAVAARPAAGWWTFPRLLWGAAASLLVAAVLFQTFIPVGSPALDGSPYFATIVDARTFDPSVSVDTVYSARDNVTVVWIDGLDYLPNFQ